MASAPEHERFSRVATGALYHAVTAVLLATEGARLGSDGGDARRLLLARCVLEHRLNERPGLSVKGLEWEEAATSLLLGTVPVTLDEAASLLVA